MILFPFLVSCECESVIKKRRGEVYDCDVRRGKIGRVHYFYLVNF